MTASLDESLALFRDKVTDCIKSKGSIMVLTHLDCDGITSGSIVTKALIRAGARCTVRTSKEFNNSVIRSIKSGSRDLCIVTDLGGGFASTIDNVLGRDNWLVLDHHQIPPEEMDHSSVINAWRYGIDGGAEICAGGMSYLAAVALDDKNKDLSPIAVVSALGDRQDVGDRKSFTGKNFEIAEEAKSQGLLETDMDLLLVGRETKPLADSLAYTSQPFIEGLTWNRDTCFSLLNSSGIPLKDAGGRWRVPADLDEDEKRKVIESVAKFASGDNATEVTSELVGYTYTLPKEDERSFLRDGREYSTMLNSCGRIGRSGVGLAICMGDRNRILQEGEEILADYRKRIRDCMNVLSSERWRVSSDDKSPYVLINGEDLIQETMTGTITSLVAGSPKNAGRIVILRTKGEEDGTIKFSSRKSFGCKSGSVNLSKLMRGAAEQCGGVGGGHDGAAGAKITKDKLDMFLKYLDTNVTNDNMQGSDST